LLRRWAWVCLAALRHQHRRWVGWQSTCMCEYCGLEAWRWRCMHTIHEAGRAMAIGICYGVCTVPASYAALATLSYVLRSLRSSWPLPESYVGKESSARFPLRHGIRPGHAAARPISRPCSASCYAGVRCGGLTFLRSAIACACAACDLAHVIAVLHPNATAQTMISRLRKINGIRIRVLTELIRLITFALTLVLSCTPPPKAGSF